MSEPTPDEAPERDENAEGALESDGSGNSADKTGEAIQAEIDAAEEDDEDDE